MNSIQFEIEDSMILEAKTEVKNTKSKGRGIFSKKIIKAGEIIESCQIIPFSAEDADKIELTFLSNYWFAWKTEEDPSQYGAFCLGNGALYNHSTNPNAYFFKNFENKIIQFIAQKDINPGDEITVKYGTIWFKDENEG
jgi:hypothetical protein